MLADVCGGVLNLGHQVGVAALRVGVKAGPGGQFHVRGQHVALVASGALAGLCAAMVVELCSFGLQWWWFEGQWQFHWAIWLGLPTLGALLVTLAGQGMQRQLLAGTLSDRLRGLGQGLL